jgi:tetratricopeptide (TPR) repeat protein
MNSDEQRARRTLADSVRKYLTDARLRGLMPQNLADAYARNPDKLINSIVSVLLPGMVARIEAEETEQITTAEIANLDIETLQGLALMANIVQEPVTESTINRDGALLFCSRAAKYLKQERYREAKMFFGKAIDIDDGIKSAWLGLAQALDCLGERQSAADARERASKLQ